MGKIFNNLNNKKRGKNSMPTLQILAKLIKILRSDGTPAQIAAGFVLGMAAGFIPFNTLHGFILWFAAILFNVSFAMFLFGYAVFSGIAYLMDPWFHSIGYVMLVQWDFLRSFWTSLYTAPIVPLTRFYNTVVIGSTIVAMFLSIPLYFFSRWFVLLYRQKIEAHIQKLRVVQIIKSTKLFELYERVKNWSEI